ncbi:hypothetical protein [Arthrobacter sp. KK5.5]|uniref:hypothetical protein n=1 Tax=Arthrobacter sp. KK5.5 TaxID=3373084 RepID=UPI003EE5DAA9
MDQIVADYVARGWRVASRTETQVILTRQRQMRMVLHTLLTIFTGGFWLIVVLFLWLNRKDDRATVTRRADGGTDIRETLSNEHHRQ